MIGVKGMSEELILDNVIWLEAFFEKNPLFFLEQAICSAPGATDIVRFFYIGCTREGVFVTCVTQFPDDQAYVWLQGSLKESFQTGVLHTLGLTPFDARYLDLSHGIVAHFNSPERLNFLVNS